MRMLTWLAVSLGLLHPALAIIEGPQPFPVQRLLEKLEARLEQQPRDPELHFTKARLHYLAFINATALVPVVHWGADAPRPAPDPLLGVYLRSLRRSEAVRRSREELGLRENEWPQGESRARFEALRAALEEELERSGWLPEPLEPAAVLSHAVQAMASFEQALALSPGYGLAMLGRASLAEQYLERRADGRVPAEGGSEFLDRLTGAGVRTLYLQAFEHTIETDLAQETLPSLGLEELVAYEAGRAFLRLTEGLPRTEELAAQRARIEEALAQLEDLSPFGTITPIVLGHAPDTRLSELLDPGARVRFDLDGDGVPRTWSWLRLDTPLLVWDPGESGAIASGRQLFGSVTFALFHVDGYAALSLLDDDADGRLTGFELEGLALWVDRDGDGRSSRAEVVSLWDAGVVALGTRADDVGRVGGGSVAGSGSSPLRCARGAWYADGRVVPSFDWVATACPEETRSLSLD